eukprot:Opistho-2@55528
MRIRNTFIIFLVSGFWHGANWTFIIWGGLNALYIMPSIIFKTNRNNIEIVAADRWFPNFKEIFNIGLTFFLTMLAWIFFRADSVTHAITYIRAIFTGSYKLDVAVPMTLVFFIVFLFLTEWIARKRNFGLSEIEQVLPNRFLRWLLYVILLLFIVFFAGKQQEFIYFQF